MLNSTPVNSRSSQAAVEKRLLEHPDLIAARVMTEEGADGLDYQVAYAVPHPERMRDAAARIYQADREKRVSQWKRTFDHTYRSGLGQSAPSFVGWTSSYTNKPLPESEMLEWRQCTVDRIRSLHPQDVLEIGCGVGLLVEALAPRCASYRATDLSPIAIARLGEFVASKPELAHVALSEREAAEIDDRPSHSVDTVIINSVIQYFPDIRYLGRVIAAAVRVVKPGGCIFIGDVRDLGSLPVFHNAVQLAKAPSGASAGWLKRRVGLAVEHERELVIDPRFFFDLARSDPRLHSAEILVKRGKAANEMTRYRYDVLLHVGDTQPTASPADTVLQAGDRPVADVLSQLETGRLKSATIENVRNRRLACDIAAMQRLQSADDRELVRDIRASLVAHSDVDSDPEDFWALSDAGLCEVRVTWSPHVPSGHFDVTLTACDGAETRPSSSRKGGRTAFTPGRLSTDPLEATYKQQLGLELQQMLRDVLPEPSMPAAVLVVDMLPTGMPAAISDRHAGNLNLPRGAQGAQ